MFFWRIQVQTDDIVQRLDEQQNGRELEGFGAMRLQPEEAERAVHARQHATTAVAAEYVRVFVISVNASGCVAMPIARKGVKGLTSVT